MSLQHIFDKKLLYFYLPCEFLSYPQHKILLNSLLDNFRVQYFTSDVSCDQRIFLTLQA